MRFAATETSTSDLLVANVLAGPLAGLAGTFKDLVGHGGELMLSGILADQAGGLIEAYAPWFGLAIVDSEDEWVSAGGAPLPARRLGGNACTRVVLNAGPGSA